MVAAHYTSQPNWKKTKTQILHLQQQTIANRVCVWLLGLYLRLRVRVNFSTFFSIFRSEWNWMWGYNQYSGQQSKFARINSIYRSIVTKKSVSAHLTRTKSITKSIYRCLAYGVRGVHSIHHYLSIVFVCHRHTDVAWFLNWILSSYVFSYNCVDFVIFELCIWS